MRNPFRIPRHTSQRGAAISVRPLRPKVRASGVEDACEASTRSVGLKLSSATLRESLSSACLFGTACRSDLNRARRIERDSTALDSELDSRTPLALEADVITLTWEHGEVEGSPVVLVVYSTSRLSPGPDRVQRRRKSESMRARHVTDDVVRVADDDCGTISAVRYSRPGDSVLTSGTPPAGHQGSTIRESA